MFAFLSSLFESLGEADVFRYARPRRRGRSGRSPWAALFGRRRRSRKWWG
jgi:hypothetical protein